MHSNMTIQERKKQELDNKNPRLRILFSGLAVAQPGHHATVDLPVARQTLSRRMALYMMPGASLYNTP